MDPTTDYRPTLDSWMTLFKIYGPDVPVPVVRAWLTEESGGNPCAIGDLPPAGATQPQEYGLAQLNAQDPSNLKMGSPESLRQMCHNGGATRAEWEHVTRPMTDAEKINHAVAAISLIRHCRDKASGYLGIAAGFDGNSGPWSLPDFWNLAKTYHASSAMANLFPAVHAALGRTPTWEEYKAGAEVIALKHGYKKAWIENVVWTNAERIGNALAVSMRSTGIV